MFMQPIDMIGKAEEFSRPVESIMMCEDFKSNFARRFSNRYISRTPVTAKQDTSLKLIPTDIPANAPERIEPCSQLSKSVTEQNGEAVKPPDKKTGGSDLRNTEVSALNMEVETLRWQLSQTEANRQMHIALLKQIVSFLNRVKEHIEYQKPELGSRKETMSARLTPKSFNLADLPRSRSVVHVNKNMEYSLSPNKKISTKKISKSISNVSGYRNSNNSWSPSKLSLTSETDTAQKITEELSRLITLANTVLNTKLPDLAYSSNDVEPTSLPTHETSEKIDSMSSLNRIDENATNAFVQNTSCESNDTFSITNKLEVKDRSMQDFVLSPSPLHCGLENNVTDVKIIEKENSTKNESLKSQRLTEKRNEYNAVNFIEDESGFSSMSSFQEIGIPIISIIPPSPCKEVSYIDEITNILDDTANWKNDSIDLDNPVKVFWV